MIKFFSEAFKITNNNIILATPLILFILIATLYKSFFLHGFIGLLTYFFMWAAFLGGWYYIVRQAIIFNYENISNEEKIKKSYSLINLTVKGVGEYFSSFIGFMILAVIFFVIFALIIYKIGITFIGSINIPYNDLIMAGNSGSPEALEAFWKTIPEAQILKVFYWMNLCLVTLPIFVFFQLFWIPAIIKDSKNIFKALWISLKFIFRNFLSSVIFFVFIGILHFSIALLSAILSANTILSFFSLFIYFYFMVYLTVIIFLFYEKFEEKNNSSCWTDSIGKDEFCRQSGKEN